MKIAVTIAAALLTATSTAALAAGAPNDVLPAGPAVAQSAQADSKPMKRVRTVLLSCYRPHCAHLHVYTVGPEHPALA